MPARLRSDRRLTIALCALLLTAHPVTVTAAEEEALTTSQRQMLHDNLQRLRADFDIYDQIGMERFNAGPRSAAEFLH